MIKTWQERLVGNRTDTAMQSEIADLRESLQAYNLANKDLSNWFDALKVDYDTAQADAQRYNWVKENKISVTYEGMQKWTRHDGSTFVCSWSLASPSTGLLLQEDTLDKMIDASMEFIPRKEIK